MVKLKELYSTKSNLLSLFRLLMAIPFWFLLDHLDSANIRILVFGLCLVGAATDMLDGYLARKFNEVTEMGKIIDPLADKIVVGVLIIKLFIAGEIAGYYFWMIILRDILIFIGGILVSKKLGRVLPSNMLGKITVISISLVILLVLARIDRQSIVFTGIYYISIVLIFSSLIGYAIRSIEFIKQQKNEVIQKS